jgi:hypothetical protein
VKRGLHYIKFGSLAFCWKDAWTGARELSVEWVPNWGRARQLLKFGFRGAA